MKWLDRIIDKRVNAVTEEKTVIKRSAAELAISTKNLTRISKDIGKWRDAQEAAEDFDYPDRIELMQIYKDVLDDAQIYSSIQLRINKATSGIFSIYEDGEINEEINAMFVDDRGFPRPWFRKFLIIAEWSKFYGNECINLGVIKDGKFEDVYKLPEENLIPQWHGFIKDYESGYTKEGINFINYDAPGFKTWLIPVGDPKDLGLLNKVTPYMIWKEVFGSWSMHADLFGQPLRVGKTNISDPEMKQNMLDMLSNLSQGAYAAIDFEDIIELLQETKSDPYKIYDGLINKCDEAISKILLGGTMITDSGSSRSQSEVHERGMNDIIFADKIDLQTVVNEKLIPRMKTLGLIPEGDFSGVWDMNETLDTLEWANVFEKLSRAGYKVDKEDVEQRMNVKLQEQETTTENIMNLYKDFL